MQMATNTIINTICLGCCFASSYGTQGATTAGGGIADNSSSLSLVLCEPNCLCWHNNRQFPGIFVFQNEEMIAFILPTT